jgi:hypothetical protein
MRSRVLVTVTLAGVLAQALVGMSAEVGHAAAAASRAETAAVVEWNRTALEAAAVSNGVREGHNLALAQAAVFDAANSIRRRYAPYRVRVRATGQESVVAATAAAAHAVLLDRYPDQQASLDAALARSLGQVPDGPAEAGGVAVGRAVAAALLELRAGDHSDDRAAHTPGSGAGIWVPTPPGFAPALEPGWGRVTPYLIGSGSRFRPPAPPALTSRTYARDFAETKTLGKDDSAARTPTQTQTAVFWNATGAKLWNQAVRQLVVAHGFEPTRAARAFALLNLAAADATIATWDTKFTYDHWRPVTAIRAAGGDGNPATAPDPDWSPLLITPPHPEYVSAASTIAGTAEVVLGGVFGHRPGTFQLASPALPGVVRSYGSFAAAADENIDARVWGGIHWHTSDRVGRDMGQRIGRYALRHALRPLHR